MIKAAVFDLDGTLVNSVNIWINIWYYSFRRVGIKIGKKEIKRFIGLPLSGILKGEGIYSKDLEKRINEESIDLIKRYSHKVKAFPDSIEILKFLKKKNVKICVASSSKDDWISTILKENRMEKYVDSFVSGEDVKRPKPYPDVFIESFRILGEKPSDGVAIGDRETDTWPAMKIGAIGILIDRENLFKDPKADYVVKNFSELRELLEKEKIV
jgi:beta-phosphoglucomutase-like phosphatase (HAD superfamily)